MNEQARYGTHPDRLQAKYATPPKKEWLSLTDKEIEDLWGKPVNCMYSVHYNAIRAIEAKLKEKNRV